MRTITLLIPTALLATAAFAPGCAEPAESPYEVSQRWEVTLTADARAAAQEFADRVDERLAAYRGAIYVDVQEFERVAFFEPKPAPDPNGYEVVPQARPYVFPDARRPIVAATPKGTVRSDEWTDRFALAQVLSVRCEVLSLHLTEVKPGSPTPFEAIVEFKLTGTRRSAVAGRAKPLPQPPEGYRYWTCGPWRSFFGFGGGVILVPDSLPGKPFEPGADELADEAVRLLKQTKPKPVDRIATGVLRYHSDTSTWRFGGSPDVKPARIHANRLDCYQGIKDEDEDKVYAPR